MASRILSANRLCIILGLLAAGTTSAQEDGRRLTLEEGRELIYALLAPHGCTKQTCTVSVIRNEYFPQNFFYYGTWANPTGSPHIGTWAVDPKTADVWDANACAEYRPARVVKLQQTLRKRIGLSEKEYKKAKGRPPMCEPDENVEVRSKY